MSLVEVIAHQMETPMPLDDIVKELARRTGRPITEEMRRTVRDTLSRLPWILQCERGLYGPARVLLDQKAFRVPIVPGQIHRDRLSKALLEPFYTLLDEPPLLTEYGVPLPTIYRLPESGQELKTPLITEVTNLVRGMGGVANLSPKAWRLAMLLEIDFDSLDTGFVDLSPLRLHAFLSSGARKNLALVIRWDRLREALVVSLDNRDEDGGQSIRNGNQLLADVLASHLEKCWSHKRTTVGSRDCSTDRIRRRAGFDAFRCRMH